MSLACPSRPSGREMYGFTIVEFIAVIMLMGVLAVVAMSKITGSDDFAPAMVTQQFIAQGRGALQMAQARHGSVVAMTVDRSGDAWRFRVTVDGADVSLEEVKRGGVDIRVTNGGIDTLLDAATDLTVSYDGWGDVTTVTIGGAPGTPSYGVQLSIIGGSARTACIYPTGYIAHGDCV